jgi:acyl-CoA synthetase (AMP-forming)/AMP-acid ligase II
MIDADYGTFRTDFQSDPRLQRLLGPGGPFQVKEQVIDGVTVRSFAQAPATIIDCFRGSQRYAERVQLVYGDTRLTFAQVRRQALGAAGRLRSDFGVQAGDRVAIAMRNLPEFVIGFWAAAAAGAVPVLLNAWWTGPELRYALDDAEVRVVIADDERAERLAGQPGPPVVGVGAPGAVADFAELAAGPPLGDGDLPAPGPDEVAVILYTSGTTGFPKGALITHRNIITSNMNMAFSSARHFVAGAGAVSATTASAPAASARQSASVAGGPLFHIGGVCGIVGSVLGGGKTVLMRKWDVEECLELAVRENVTTLGGVPATARQVLEHPGASRLRGQIASCPLGGAAVPPDLPLLAREVLGDGVSILNGYGSTETTSAVLSCVGEEYFARPGSVGRPNLTAELRIEDPDGQPLPPGQVGELCFRSPQVVKGYWKNAEATKTAFAGGWFHTGDLGYVDDDGYAYVVDRLKDVVIRGGENVYCAEVEAQLFRHPAVADTAVIGVPDHAMGERVGAVVVLRDGASLTLDELRAFTAGSLASFKRPEVLFVVEEIPQTPTQKTDKRKLREQLLHPDL